MILEISSEETLFVPDRGDIWLFVVDKRYDDVPESHPLSCRAMPWPGEIRVIWTNRNTE